MNTYAVHAKNLNSLIPGPGAYLKLVRIGTTKFEPPATIEAIDRVEGEGSIDIDPEGTDIHLSVWMGVDRPHAMTGILVDLDDLIEVEVHIRR